jgi:hypothetical protein
MEPKDGTNHGEVVETLLSILGHKVEANEQNGQLPDPKDLAGYQNVAQHVQNEIQIISQDPNEKQRVAAYGQLMGKIMNLVKAQAQRLEEQMKKQQEAAAQNGGGMDPKDKAKVQAMMLQAQVKAKTTSDAHAQRTAQRQIQFNLETKRDQQRHKMKMQEEAQKSGHALASDHLATRQELSKTAASVRQDLKHNMLKAALDRRNAAQAAKNKPKSSDA